MRSTLSGWRTNFAPHDRRSARPRCEPSAPAQGEYAVRMETLSGVAREPQTQAVDKKTMLRFKVDGRSVELEPARAARCWPIGGRRPHGGRTRTQRSANSARVLEPVLGLNRTRLLWTETDRRSVGSGGWRCHFGRGLGSPSDIAFFRWAERVGGTAVAALFWLGTALYFHTTRHNISRRIQSDGHRIGDGQGSARDVEYAKQRSPRGRLQSSKINMKLDGQSVELHGFPRRHPRRG
jgi:hypothetical protein